MLVRDDAAVPPHPLPYPLDELLPPQVVSRQPLFRQLLFHYVLRRDSRVVHTRQPQRRVAEHAMPADQAVFDRRRQRVAEVQFASHVWRRHDDAERLLVRVDARSKVAALQPRLVQRPFHL